MAEPTRVHQTSGLLSPGIMLYCWLHLPVLSVTLQLACTFAAS